MTDKKSSESRRKLLKSIAAGSGAVVAGKTLPDSWSKPVVDSVMLPAHAATSPVQVTETITDGWPVPANIVGPITFVAYGAAGRAGSNGAQGTGGAGG